ncbi:MAG TPA: hypothetical protein VIX19_00470 [Terriglobales bacterium]
MTARPLTFGEVDALGFAAARGRLDLTRLPAPYAADKLGPLLELVHLAAAGRLPDPAAGRWLVPNGTAQMVAALLAGDKCWLSSHHRPMGFIRAVRSGPDGENRLTAFLMDAQRAARDVARLRGRAPGQLVAAMEELESNIHEHSKAAHTGLLAFRAARGVFEFVVADRGIGILTSLQSNAMYTTLLDHGTALRLALTDGTSRFGDDKRRGHGFRPIFLGLMDLRGALRFRSGDHALTMDGTSPSLATAELAQKTTIDGFLASICVITQT